MEGTSMLRHSIDRSVRTARTIKTITWWAINLVFVLGVAFMVSPDGYVKAQHYRETHVVVSVTDDPKLRDLAKTLTAYDFQQIDCMAKNAYFEARGEGDGGIDRVNDVVLNRASNVDRYPDGPCQVVTEKNQFSWYSDGHDHSIRDWPIYNHIYNRSYNKYIYRKAGLVPDLTGGALHYHADYVNPHWKWDRLGSWGHHIFYR